MHGGIGYHRPLTTKGFAPEGVWKTEDCVGCVVRRALMLDFWGVQADILGKMVNTNLQKLKSENAPFAYHQAILWEG